MWADWLRHPCHLGGPQRFTAGAEMRSSPHVGRLDTSLLPSNGTPTLQSRGQPEKWPTCGYINPAVWGVPNASYTFTRMHVS